MKNFGKKTGAFIGLFLLAATVTMTSQVRIYVSNDSVMLYTVAEATRLGNVG